MREIINNFRAAFGMDDLPPKDESRALLTEGKARGGSGSVKKQKRSKRPAPPPPIPKKHSTTVIINGEDVTDQYTDADGNVDFPDALRGFARFRK